jgi:soluble lytic murein transglycosylase
MPASTARLLPARLIRLAARATRPAGWSALRAYGAASPRGEVRGYAYFALGYREFAAGQYSQAETDLAQAVAGGFPLRDIAVYYLARANYQDGQPSRVVSLLQSFSRQYPESTVLSQAVGLLAWAYLQSGQAGQAVRALTSYPQTFQRPDMALQLALAYEASGYSAAAARLYQDIYFAFPTAPEAKTAGEALQVLKVKLGPQYPHITDRIASSCAERLFDAGRYQGALDEYLRLLKNRPRSPMVWQWILGKARCLLRLGREPEAIRVLNSVAPLSPPLNAERLGMLVEATMDTGDEAGMNRALDQLRIHESRSRWYAEALFSAASYYMRKGRARLAVALYRTLAESFPKLPQGEEALWRAAWLTYLQGKPTDARAAFLNYIRQYPYSLQTAGALYFLGRLAEEQGDSPFARGLYKLVRRKYGHSYYALQSAARLQRLSRVRSAAARTGAIPPSFNIQALASLIPPPRRLPLDPCLHPSSDEMVRPYLELASLSLRKLAAGELNALSHDHPAQPDLIFALSRIEVERGRPDRAIYLMGKLVGRYQDAPFPDFPRRVWALLYPRSYWPLVDREARLYGLDPYLAMAVIREESGFYSGAISTAGAIGLMQILDQPRTFRARALGARLKNPWYNVRAGCAYLRELIKRYHGNVAAALAAYNAGPTRVDGWLSAYSFRTPQEFIETIPFPGTRIYVQAILRDQILYRRLLMRTAKYKACRVRQARLRVFRRRVSH